MEDERFVITLSVPQTAGNKTITKEGAQNLAADIEPSSSTLSQYNNTVLDITEMMQIVTLYLCKEEGYENLEGESDVVAQCQHHQTSPWILLDITRI
ncbi:hypothetical protein J6590_081914 [Homalodisca vitripennis]|nr:hypothetical protein J6590_081914 [Homalodisca vitripennis]